MKLRLIALALAVFVPAAMAAPPRAIPGITAKDVYPAGCVDCHVKEMRLSTLLARLNGTVDARLRAQWLSIKFLRPACVVPRGRVRRRARALAFEMKLAVRSVARLLAGEEHHAVQGTPHTWECRSGANPYPKEKPGAISLCFEHEC